MITSRDLTGVYQALGADVQTAMNDLGETIVPVYTIEDLSRRIAPSDWTLARSDFTFGAVAGEFGGLKIWFGRTGAWLRRFIMSSNGYLQFGMNDADFAGSPAFNNQTDPSVQAFSEAGISTNGWDVAFGSPAGSPIIGENPKARIGSNPASLVVGTTFYVGNREYCSPGMPIWCPPLSRMIYQVNVVNTAFNGSFEFVCAKPSPPRNFR